MIADSDGFAFLQPPVGDQVTVSGTHTEHLGLFFNSIAQGLVVAVRANNVHTQLFFQFHGPAYMVDVAVGDQYFFNGHTGLFDRISDVGNVPAGIDNSAKIGFAVPDQRAILLKWGDLYDSDLQLSHLGPFSILMIVCGYPILAGNTCEQGQKKKAAR